MLEYFRKTYTNSKQDFYAEAKDNLQNNKRMFVITANPEMFMKGRSDSEFDELMKSPESTIIADGIGILKGAKMLGIDIKEKIMGVDLAAELLRLCNDNNYKLALLGAKEEVLEKFKTILKTDYPNINLVKAENGYIQDKDAFFDDIAALQPDVCLVALGIPSQEKLIYKHLGKFEKGIFVGVGGSFDVLSGSKKRAPKIFLKLNLEWLYRILKEPKRLKRFYDSNVKFIFIVKKLARKRGEK